MIGDERGERARESVRAASETPAVSRRNHLLLLLCTINTTGVRSDLARSQSATGEIHYACSHQPRIREQCCIVAAPLCSWTWSIVALTCCKPNNHSGTSMVFVPLRMQHARLVIVFSDIIIPMPDNPKCSLIDDHLVARPQEFLFNLFG